MIRPIVKPAEQRDWYPRGETPYIENLKRQVASMPSERHGYGYGKTMTPKLVRAIRAEYVPYHVTAQMLSVKYGVKLSTLRSMLEGKTYGDVK